MFTQNNYAKEDIDFLIKNYPKQGVDFCAKGLNRSKKAIYTKISKMGLKFDNYVSYIDVSKMSTQKGAYLLGFLWADGNLKKKSSIVRCSITQKDGLDLRDIFEYVGKWRIFEKFPEDRQPQMHFEVWDTTFYTFLQNLDYKEKSLRTPSKVSAFLAPELHPYFWRGYFDGDGCFSVSQSIQANVSGPIEQSWDDFLQLLKKIEVEYRFELYKLKSGNSSRVTFFGYFNLLRFGNYIYSGEIFGLKGKYQKFYEIYDRAMIFNKSKKGYWYDKKRKLYSAEIMINDKKILLGSFKTEEEAQIARAQAVEKYNIPEFQLSKLLELTFNCFSGSVQASRE